MPQVCRTGDHGVGVCYQHKKPRKYTTTFIKGAATVIVNGQELVCIGGLGKTSCGHTTMATTGSATVDGEVNKVHRVGDVGIVIGGGHYTATTGSPDTFAGD